MDEGKAKEKKKNQGARNWCACGCTSHKYRRIQTRNELPLSYFYTVIGRCTRPSQWFWDCGLKFINQESIGLRAQSLKGRIEVKFHVKCEMGMCGQWTHNYNYSTVQHNYKTQHPTPNTQHATRTHAHTIHGGE